MRKLVLVALLLVPVVAGGTAIQAQEPEDLQTALVRLTVAVERLVILLEQKEALEAADGNSRQVEVAVDILGLRYRKIEQLQGEIKRINREEEYFPQTLEMMRSEIERIEINGRSEGGELQEWARSEIDTNELRIKLEEERMKSLREQKLLLENDLMREQRRLTSVEELLDEWLDGL